MVHISKILWCFTHLFLCIKYKHIERSYRKNQQNDKTGKQIEKRKVEQLKKTKQGKEVKEGKENKESKENKVK